MAFEDGPYLQIACFCDMVLRDETGVISLIRVVDSITHTERGPTPPESMPPVSYPLKLVLVFKSGTARGRSTVKLVPEKPDGSTEDPLYFSVHFEGEERGVGLILDFRFIYTLEGLYWFFVYIEDQEVTAMPIRVKYDRVIVGKAS